MALTDLTRISTSGIATGSTIDAAILRKDVSFRGSQVGVQTALFDASDDELKFQPNAKLSFGGTSLQIYHGSNVSHIAENGTGPLRLSTDEFQVMNSAQNKTMIHAAQNLAVSLNYNGNTKIETTNHGAVVTGILTASSFSGPIGNPSGISTFYDLRVTNNLTVEGTTSTLDTDLIGVDRVEVGANSNSVVGVAITQSGTADIVNLFDGTTEVLTVVDGGDVGIGTATIDSSYGTNLNIHSSGNNTGARIKLTDGTSGTGNVDGFDIFGINGRAYVFNRENYEMVLGTDNKIRLRIDDDGAISVGHNPGQSTGTNTQNAILTLKGYPNENESSAAILALIRGYNTTSATTDHTIGRIVFGDKQAGEYAFIEGEVEANGGSVGDTPGRLVFSTAPDGTSAPEERLRISQNGNITVNKGNASNNATIILSKADAGFAKLEFDVGTSQKAYVELDASESLVHYGAANVEQQFYAGGGKRMTINKDGDIAIGNHTPDGQLSIRAANASFPRLVISNEDNDENINLSTYHDSNGIYAFLGANAKLNSSGNITRDTTSHKSSGLFLDARNNGNLVFYTGGTSGNPVQRLNISDGGNITIGTASAAGGKLYFESTSGAAQYIASGGTDNQDLIIGSSADEFVVIDSDGHTLFSGLTTKNDTRNARGISIKSSSGGGGISFQNYGANGSHNWRIRPDDMIGWGTLEFSVSPTSNSSTDWPDATTDVVMTLHPDKNVTINNGSIEADDNTLSSISKTASSSTYYDVFVYDTRKDSDGGAWRHRTTNTSWYNETLNTSIRGARREFPQVAIVAVGSNTIHIFDADDPDMPMWMEFPSPSGGARNVMYGTGNPRCVYMLNGILCTGSQATNYWPVVIDFIRDDIIGLRDSGGHLHYNGRQGVISLRNSATSDNGKWWPGTLTGGPTGGGRVTKRWWFDGSIVNNHVTSVVMSVRPEAPIDKTTGMQIPTIYLGTRGGVSIIHSNVGDIGTSYSSGIYDITSNNGAYSAVGDITITDDGYLWTLHDYYTADSSNYHVYYRDSSAIDLKRLDNQMNDIVTRPDQDVMVSGFNNQGGGSANKGREYYWPSTGAEGGSHKIGYTNAWAANIVERDAWGCVEGFALVKRSIYTYDHKENTSFLPLSHTNRGLVAMITKDYNTGWHMTGNEVSSAYIADGLTSSISGSGAMIDRGHKARHLTVSGTLTRSKCATGSDLSAVSGFSASNYARIISSNINAGNPLNITMMGWIKITDISGYSYICSIANGGGSGMGIAINQTNASLGGKPYFYDSTHGSMQGDISIHDGEWHHVCGVFSCNSNRKLLYVDGQRQLTVVAPANIDYSDLDTIAVGHWCGSGTGVSHSCLGHLALVRLGLTDLTDQQIKRIYEDEKKLLLPNAKAFLYGTSNEIKAIGYDEKKEIYHVGTSSGRSDFSGLSRINNTTTAVTTAISAYDGLIAEQ